MDFHEKFTQLPTSKRSDVPDIRLWHKTQPGHMNTLKHIIWGMLDIIY